MDTTATLRSPQDRLQPVRPLKTNTFADPEVGLIQMLHTEDINPQKMCTRSSRNGDIVFTTKHPILIPSSPLAPKSEYDSEPKPSWSPFLPIYIEGSIKIMPTALFKTIQEYESKRHGLLTCVTNLWPTGGSTMRTLVHPGVGKVAKWTIRGSGEEVDMGRFQYGTNKQILVAHHPKFNHGRPSIIEWHCRSHDGRKFDGPEVVRSRWSIWEPLPDSIDPPEIERITTPASIPQEPGLHLMMEDEVNAAIVPSLDNIVPPLSPSPLTSDSSTISVAQAGFSPLTRPKSVLEPSHTKPMGWREPRKSLIVTLKVPRMSEKSLFNHATDDEEYTTGPSAATHNRLSSASTLIEPPRSSSPLTELSNNTPEYDRDISSKECGNGNLEIQDCIASGRLAVCTSVVPLSTDSGNIDIGTNQSLQEETPVGQDHKNQTYLHPTPNLPARPNVLSTPNTTTTSIQYSVQFSFKESQEGKVVRRRPYALCKTVQMLYSQALAAGIAKSDTAILSVQVQDQAPRMVPRGDHLDYDEVKNAIAEAEQRVKETTTAHPVTIEVTVLNYEWD